MRVAVLNSDDYREYFEDPAVQQVRRPVYDSPWFIVWNLNCGIENHRDDDVMRIEDLFKFWNADLAWTQVTPSNMAHTRILALLAECKGVHQRHGQRQLHPKQDGGCADALSGFWDPTVCCKLVC